MWTWAKDRLPDKEKEVILNTNGTINIAKLVVATPDVWVLILHIKGTFIL